MRFEGLFRSMEESNTVNNAQKIRHARQKVTDLTAHSPVRRLELVMLRIYPRRMVYSEQYVGPVAAACGRDETGIVGVILWNDQIKRVNVGDILVIESGWCREKNGELVVSTGKNGRLFVLR